ncbi:thrombospondin type-1 domain-containing protein 1 isoform X2 [Thalassophryne amazonica]|uniref:thrombospondin type-1 domain-containing protein 1 isoform X2 n=1 Tax=Thalassophryne amazonica TaxID=390379 RepID=UPI0014713EB6|nr:thrombospondin type-1 domain-containing protein 1 isoform X2 [Thalassophryne amazonica]
MPQASVSLWSFLLAFMGYTLAAINIWPSFHIALSNASVFVDFGTKSNSSTVRYTSLSLVNMETNATLLTRSLADNQSRGRMEFNCSCFLYAGTFRFLLQGIKTVPRTNTTHGSRKGITTWWWSSELQVQWPTFHIAVDRAGNHSASFQVGIFTNEHFQPCSSSFNSAVFMEVSFIEYNQIGQNTINKVRARTRHPVKPLRSQNIELPCAFPFTDRDFIQVALRSPHAAQDVKSSGPLYLSRIFPYKMLVENANAYRSGCEGTMAVKLITPPCAHISGKVLLYKERGAVVSSENEEPFSPLLAFSWLTHGENETEFNCSVFHQGRNKYCFRFVFNFSRSPSPAQTCLVVYKSSESWGPWQPWSVCSVSCGEGVRERVRECLLPSGGGKQCKGVVKEQSPCSLEECAVLNAPSPSFPAVSVGHSPLDGNMAVMVGISLCLAVILATIVFTVWKKVCQPPQCSSVHRASVPSSVARKLSDEATICGDSLQRPSLSENHGPPGGEVVSIAQKDRPLLDGQPSSQTLVIPLPHDPERLSPIGQKMLPPIFGYHLAQQQLKEMKKKGLKEATQLYHVSSSPVHDTLVETPAHMLPLGPHDNSGFCVATPFSGTSLQSPSTTPERLSPRVELVLGPPVSGHSSGDSTKWHNRTADWVKMIERSGLAHLREADVGLTHSFKQNPNFRRTSSFNDTKPHPPYLANSRQFRERSMTQVASRTLPEGRGWIKSRTQNQSQPSYPILENVVSEWSKSRPSRNDQRQPWIEMADSSHNSELKHTETNTNINCTSEKYTKANLSGAEERDRCSKAEGNDGKGISGIRGQSIGPVSSQDMTHASVDHAKSNWIRCGALPIQRSILPQKLKETQPCTGFSGHKGRQRSSTFSASVAEQRKARCGSLPESGHCINSSTYRLSEAEQKMLDLDLSSAYVGKKM